MIRAPLGNLSYWNEWVDYSDFRVVEMLETLKKPSHNHSYEPQYIFELSKKYWHQMLRRYSRGDDIKELSQYFPPLLDAWEQSEALGQSVFTEQQQYARHTWAVNFDHYIVCFWLVGLALALELPDDQWQRLIVLIGNEGADALLDSIIAMRQPGRKIGGQLCHPRPYQRLLDAVNAPVAQQPRLLADFVNHWYKELNRPATKERAAAYNRPYWYLYGNRNFEGGAYFGRWCVEAVAAVKAFGLDDSLCLGHEHYPGDLLRPEEPSTHPGRPDDATPDVPPFENPYDEVYMEKKKGILAQITGFFKTRSGR
jgi:hypothetical protein